MAHFRKIDRLQILTWDAEDDSLSNSSSSSPPRATHESTELPPTGPADASNIEHTSDILDNAPAEGYRKTPPHNTSQEIFKDDSFSSRGLGSNNMLISEGGDILGKD